MSKLDEIKAALEDYDRRHGFDIYPDNDPFPKYLRLLLPIVEAASKVAQSGYAGFLNTNLSQEPVCNFCNADLSFHDPHEPDCEARLFLEALAKLKE